MKITGNIPAGVQITKEVHGDAVMLVGDEALKARIAHLTNLIEEHNRECQRACILSTKCGAYRDRGLWCPKCPMNLLIDLTDGGK